jgi:hypothetical protein
MTACDDDKRGTTISRTSHDDRPRPTFEFLIGGEATAAIRCHCRAHGPTGGDMFLNDVHRGVPTQLVRSFVQMERVSNESTSMTHFDDVRWMM